MEKDRSQQESRKKRVSPWEAYAEEFRASARAYNELSRAGARIFRPLQQEAIEQWLEWEAETEAEEGKEQ